MRKSSKRVKMYLYLNGVASRDLGLALVAPGRVERERTVREGTRTEKFLPTLMAFVGKIIPAGIIVAQGGGSFTQARLAVAIANALAYAWGIKVATVSAELRLEHIAHQIKHLHWSNLALPRYRGPGVR